MNDRLADFFIVVVSGDRHWNPTDLIQRELRSVHNQHDKVIVISGGAPGVDSKTKFVCEINGWFFVEVPAPWEFFKRKAGPIRNSWMLIFEPDLVLCFHRDIENSKGTKDMKKKAEKAGISVRLVEG